jgi:hypothetical protein
MISHLPGFFFVQDFKKTLSHFPAHFHPAVHSALTDANNIGQPGRR